MTIAHREAGWPITNASRNRPFIYIHMGSKRVKMMYRPMDHMGYDGDLHTDHSPKERNLDRPIHDRKLLKPQTALGFIPLRRHLLPVAQPPPPPSSATGGDDDGEGTQRPARQALRAGHHPRLQEVTILPYCPISVSSL
jgi:hypothetical protein